jgi:hypothetical protein
MQFLCRGSAYEQVSPIATSGAVTHIVVEKGSELNPYVPQSCQAPARGYCRPARTDVIRWVLKPSQCIRPT